MTSQEAASDLQARDDGDLDRGGSSEGGEKCADSR